ncbi:hypothetical protein F5J12DRAFT_783354 [Pisolithus orientalis]|uniref:uncharacterized protein n=1 Tax=Pisolithus orientalis TaxID=936130 RepID=UPI0022256A3F|nr:uncharacterized protein F5J12DRAFT_783354 [Pisolithus orientalis]KAI6004356.1 hypothetical protein F5J12DRAFT_783354 [Pisolithus orientalis]
MAGIQNGSSELRALSKIVGQQSVTIEKLMTCLQTVEEEVAVLHAWMETQQDDHLESSRGRRAMKLYIHPLFADLCGIKRSLEHGVRALALMHVKPLDTCEPFKQIDQKTHVWHTNCLGQTWCQQTGKGELPDSDYSMPIIKECVKTYFQNIHKEWVTILEDLPQGIKVAKYIAFLHHLTLKSTKNLTADSDGTVDPDIAASTLNAPPRKCRKSDKKTWKQTFDAPPGMMYDQGLQLHKKKPVLPFKNMVDNACFYSQLQEGALLKEDAKYLSELEKWKEHKEHENNADQSDIE